MLVQIWSGTYSAVECLFHQSSNKMFLVSGRTCNELKYEDIVLWREGSTEYLHFDTKDKVTDTEDKVSSKLKLNGDTINGLEQNTQDGGKMQFEYAVQTVSDKDSGTYTFIVSFEGSNLTANTSVFVIKGKVTFASVSACINGRVNKKFSLLRVSLCLSFSSELFFFCFVLVIL